MRVPARTKGDALKRYVRYLQLSLSCISGTAQFVTGPRPYGGEDALALTTKPERMRLRCEDETYVFLAAAQGFHFEADPDFEGEWKVKTDEYAYSVFTSDEESGQLFAWHWHPAAYRADCHIHVGARQGEERALYRYHVPSGRVAFEEVLRFLLEEFHVESARDDSEEILTNSQTRFEAFRTWPGVRRPPSDS